MSGALPEVLRAAARVAVPWKNGGGLTREVCAAPAAAGFDAFDWRISTAEVRSPGPFSSFPGIDRTLCVLEGVLHLEVAGRGEHRLNRNSPPYGFPGEIAVHGVPVGGAVIDLNVMVRRGRSGAQVERRLGPGVLAMRAAVTVLYALTPLTAAGPRVSYRLEAHDALRARAGGELRVIDPGAHWVVIELSVPGGPP
ncbi:MAG: HutD family protein [Proteobacteria bacterium]|nr:HutD family protein [Pseudomonadota bacterium]